MSSKKTILITGGAGYIGSHTIIEILENTDFNIVCVDNFSNSSLKTIKRIEKLTGRGINYYNIDMCSKYELERVFGLENDIVGVIHFAAYKSVPESVSNPFKYYNNNINSLLNVLECCLKYNVNNFIFSSSCSVYGNIDKLPVTEDTTFGKAESPYGYTKQIGEEILKNYSRSYPDLKIISLRYFNPVGAHISGLIGEDPINDPTNLVSIITQTAIGKIKEMVIHGGDYNTRDGSCIRDYIHVTDVSIAHIKALEYIISDLNKTNYSVFNIGTGLGVSVFEAIKSFEKVSGVKLNYKVGPKRDGDVVSIYSDCTLSKKELNWDIKFNLDEMMLSSWKWEIEKSKS
jgi:UDP-glucose 4-epimerase